MSETTTPSTHHLDRRADRLLTEQGDDDDLLTTKQLADWFGVSQDWVAIARCKGYGPKWIHLGPRLQRCRRGDAREWLRDRARYSKEANEF
jgi:hypothetical protein